MSRADDPGLRLVARRLAGTAVPALAMYKDRCLRRRLAVRMRARRVASLGEYAALLDRDPGELALLVEALSVQVTAAFRNPEAWRRLAADLDDLVATGEPVLAWSAGCASGEEAWTIAMLLADAMARAGRSWEAGTLRVDATDLSPEALARAAAGTCPASAFADVPADLLARWTLPAGRNRQVADPLRAAVRFAVGDLGRDPPPRTGYDLIVCRNVLIYFSREAQERLLHRFADALRPGGLLMLGKVESLVGTARDRLAVVDARERLFRREAR